MTGIDKAPYGSPCNSCGLCCLNEPCPLGSHLFGVKHGRCPALVKLDDRTFACGLAHSPQSFVDVTCIEQQRDLSEAAAHLIGAGVGCDARVAGEPDSPGWKARFRQSQSTPAAKAKTTAAIAVWSSFLTWMPRLR